MPFPICFTHWKDKYVELPSRQGTGPVHILASLGDKCPGHGGPPVTKQLSVADSAPKNQDCNLISPTTCSNPAYGAQCR